MKNTHLITSIVLVTTALSTTSIFAQNESYQVEKTVSTHVAGSSVQQEIQNQISSDPLLKGSHIEVEERNNNIILKGDVDSERSYERAITIAYSIKGVQNVDVNQLVLKCSEHPNEDYVAAARVRGVLISEGLVPVEYVHREFMAWPVLVIVEQGVVTIGGFVENEEMKTRITKVVGGVQNIKSVNTNVTIRSGSSDTTSVSKTGAAGQSNAVTQTTDSQVTKQETQATDKAQTTNKRAQTTQEQTTTEAGKKGASSSSVTDQEKSPRKGKHKRSKAIDEQSQGSSRSETAPGAAGTVGSETTQTQETSKSEKGVTKSETAKSRIKRSKNKIEEEGSSSSQQGMTPRDTTESSPGY